MLVDVETLLFNAGGNSQTVAHIHTFKDQEAHCRGPETYNCGSECLRSEESPSGGDANKACENAVESKRQRGFAIFQPTERECGKTAGTSCKVGVEEYQRY